MHTLIVQKVYFMPVVRFIILPILTFTLFNVSCLGWAVVYTLGSFIASYIALFIMKTLNKKVLNYI
nr:YbeF family protein [Bacillus pumilus]